MWVAHIRSASFQRGPWASRSVTGPSGSVGKLEGGGVGLWLLFMRWDGAACGIEAAPENTCLASVETTSM